MTITPQQHDILSNVSMCFATGSCHVPPHSAFPHTELIHFSDGIAYQQLQQLCNEHAIPGMGWPALGLSFNWQLQHEEIQN